MKLSTYIERLMERGWRREAAEEAAILAKEAGAEWDPEEPEGGSEKPATILVAPLVKWAERRLAANPGGDEADALGSLLEILELQTEDPEEPELPDRVRVRNRITGDGADLLPEDGPWESREQGIAGVRELAARYNALPRILADLEEIAGARAPLPVTTMERQHAASFASLVRSTLALERERLT